MSLAEYKKKRTFTKTPEPAGKVHRGGDELLFVIQKHAASHLHYDFRLELKGVLKSWAVPKGPSMNPEDKRLAMLVEDHPFDYKDFEGIIPKGNYGAGTVIIWDQGTYEPVEETATKAEREKLLLKAFYSGSMRIRMHGKKLKGEFALVQSKNRGDNSWLLVKKNDQHAIDADITEKDKSVVSGKTIEQVAENKSAKQWISNRASDGKLKDDQKESAASTVKSKPLRKEERAEKKRTEAAEDGVDYSEKVKELITGDKSAFKKKSPFPADLKPMLATLVDKPFDDPEWIYEVKWDGYRALAYLQNGSVDLRSRNNNDFNTKFYPVTHALKQWRINAIVDGEVVVVNEEGLSSFSDLQEWQNESDGELLYYVFDLLWLEGYSLMHLPLLKRREILKQLLPDDSVVRYSENFDVSGTVLFEEAKKLGLEGIIAKKADSVYKPDTRTKDWLKVKTEQRHEAVIAGYTRNEGSGKRFSALILGVYKDGKLTFIGQAGTGFTDKMQDEILKKLKPLETNVCPFPEPPVINKPTRFRRKPPKTDVRWVKPEYTCEVRYQELSNEGIMRHPAFVPGSFARSATEAIAAAPAEKRAPRTTRSERGQFLPPGKETIKKSIKGHTLEFTNLSKIYWPKEKISKRDMLNYYYSVAEYMLPYMKDRPQSLNRHPNGIKGESFYQKNVSGKVEPWIKTHAYENTTSEGNKTFLVCTDEASLMYIAKLGCIEMNPWHSRVQHPDRPDWCVIDLDPDDNPFEQVIEAATVVHEILEAINVPSYPKTSGSTGMHIYIPLEAKYDYDQSKQLAELIVTLAHQQLGKFTSLERSPAKRRGKLYLDYLQNRAIQTIAAPYSLRPKPGATASAPLHWEEVKPGLKMSDFTIYNMLDRIKSEGDLFKGVLGKGIDLAKVLDNVATVFG